MCRECHLPPSNADLHAEPLDKAATNSVGLWPGPMTPKWLKPRPVTKVPSVPTSPSAPPKLTLIIPYQAKRKQISFQVKELEQGVSQRGPREEKACEATVGGMRPRAGEESD